jgi:hypothetical protein
MYVEEALRYEGGAGRAGGAGHPLLPLHAPRCQKTHVTSTASWRNGGDRIRMFLDLPDPHPLVRGSVADPDPPDPHVFGPPGSGS